MCQIDHSALELRRLELARVARCIDSAIAGAYDMPAVAEPLLVALERVNAEMESISLQLGEKYLH